MDYKTGRRSNSQKKWWNQISLYPHIYRLMHKWGFKQKVPRKVHVNTASKEEKEHFKKEQERYWITLLQKEGFTVVSTDESFFFYDSLVRKIWIRKDERPVVSALLHNL